VLVRCRREQAREGKEGKGKAGKKRGKEQEPGKEEGKSTSKGALKEKVESGSGSGERGGRRGRRKSRRHMAGEKGIGRGASYANGTETRETGKTPGTRP
jgi:hypothetical protein